MTLKSAARRMVAPNVVAILRGSDPELKNELVVYTAHWDHLGMRPDQPGDNIYNGAVDNASGTAALLTIARACAALPQRPARSILFAAVGAEEQGLLGSEYLAEHPPIPAGNLAAVINIDGVNERNPVIALCNSPVNSGRSSARRV